MVLYKTAKSFILTLILLSTALVIACGGGGGDGAEGTASMEVARGEHAALLLPDGRVLVIGGRSVRPVALAEFYDPSTGQWTSGGDMEQARYEHTVTPLPSGLLLITGGNTMFDRGYSKTITEPLASVEMYDPSAGTFSSVGSMAYEHGFGHTATLLQDGKVLVAGGRANTGVQSGQSLVTAYSELYDPSTGKWSLTGDMTEAREKHTAILLEDGKILIVGGSSSEVYDPNSGTWSKTGQLPNDHGVRFTATLLRDGRVLVAGGGLGSGTEIPTAVGNADLYDPSTGEWSTVNDMAKAEFGHTATRLEDGRVFVVGTLSAQIYDPDADIWSSVGQMSTERGAEMVEGPSGALHTATLLEDNRVLIIGGAELELSRYGVELRREGIASVEIYDPAKGW